MYVSVNDPTGREKLIQERDGIILRAKFLNGQKEVGPRAQEESLDSNRNRNSSAFIIGGKVKCK